MRVARTGLFFAVLAPVIGGDPFYDPPSLCSVLEPRGFKTSEWSRVSNQDGAPYYCQYPPVPPREHGSIADLSAMGITARGPAFVYRVWGRRTRRADAVSFALTLTGEHEKIPAKARFVNGVNDLFRALGARPPDGLLRAIDKQTGYRSAARSHPAVAFSASRRDGKEVLWLRLSPSTRR